MTMSEINVFKDTRQLGVPSGLRRHSEIGGHLSCELQSGATITTSQSSYSLTSTWSARTDNSGSPTGSAWSLTSSPKQMNRKQKQGKSKCRPTARVTCPPCLSGDISAVDSQGRSLLYYAARYGQSDTLLQLLQAGCDPDRADGGGRTPLHEAVDRGNIDIVRLLLKEGNADVGARSTDGQTPFLTAVSRGQLDIVRLLHRHGANPDECDDEGIPPICRAFKQGWSDVADFLLDRRCDVNRCSANGESCFYAATHNGKPLSVDVIRKLLKTDYDLKKDKYWIENEGCPLCLRDDAKLHKKVLEGAGIVEKSPEKKSTFRKISVGKAKFIEKLSRGSSKET